MSRPTTAVRDEDIEPVVEIYSTLQHRAAAILSPPPVNNNRNTGIANRTEESQQQPSNMQYNGMKDIIF
jgi:hypothetical protein